jgi:hypothetical protein
MRSNRKLIRKNRKVLMLCAICRAKQKPIPLFRNMWMNFEIERVADKIRENMINKKRKHEAQ